MAGYIRRRGKGSWEVTVDLGRDPATGRRRRRFFTVRGKREGAERALTADLRERDLGNDLDPGRVTVDECLRRWLRDYAAQNVAASTLQRYKGIVEQHLVPGLGSLRLRDLRPAHIQAAYAAFARRDGRGPRLSAKTIFEHHAVLREALNWAVRLQLLGRNPAQAVSPPRPQRPEMRVLSPADAQRLLEVSRPTRYYSLIYLALATGARLGELLAVRWQEVDLERGVVEITRTARFFSGQGVTFGQPKTHRSRRPIALSPETLAVLREHRQVQLEERLQVGPGYRDGDLVFADAVGRALYDSTVRRAFYAIVQEAGLAHLRIHDLRHTAATLMLRAGVNPKVVSERLGHATVSVTLDTYSHVLPDLQREAAAALDAILVGNRSANSRP
jgi:integrase